MSKNFSMGSIGCCCWAAKIAILLLHTCPSAKSQPSKVWQTGIFQANLILTKQIKDIVENIPGYLLALYSGQLLLIHIIHAGRNKISLKINKNDHFSLNKVQKMRNKKFFFIKYKMLKVYGFNMDFQFWAKKWLPRDL